MVNDSALEMGSMSIFQILIHFSIPVLSFGSGLDGSLPVQYNSEIQNIKWGASGKEAFYLEMFENNFLAIYIVYLSCIKF